MAKKKKIIAKKKVRKKNIINRRMNKHLAVTGLVINIVIAPLPGIGSFIGGRYRSATGQMLIALIGDILIISDIYHNTNFGVLGFLIVIAMWIWALMTGISMLQEAYPGKMVK